MRPESWSAEAINEIMRLRLQSWAKSLIVLCDNVIDGPMKVRPAVQGMLTSETQRFFYLGNKVRLKYGTVLAVADVERDHIWLVAQPIWKGVLREPEERRVDSATRPFGRSVLSVSGMRRYTWFNPNDLGDMHGERDVLYLKPLDLRQDEFFTLHAEGDIPSRDGFAEFTGLGRDAIDLFTNQVIVDAIDDFVPEDRLSPDVRTSLSNRQAELAPLSAALEEMAKQQHAGRPRPATSTVSPRDFGDLDIQ